MVDRSCRTARPHESLRILLPCADDIVDRVVRGIGGSDEHVIVLGHAGEQSRVVEADRRLVQRDSADHSGAGGQDRVRLTVHGRELAEADGAAGTRDVDDLGVVREPVDAHGLLGLTGEPVPAAAGTGRSDEREIRRQIALRRGGFDRVGRRRSDRRQGDRPVGDATEGASRRVGGFRHGIVGRWRLWHGLLL